MSAPDDPQVHHLLDEYCFQALFLIVPKKLNSKIRSIEEITSTQKLIMRVTFRTAGSFISFHMPSTPLEMKSLTKPAHQERAFDCVKSGKTQSPGHTSPKNG